MRKRGKHSDPMEAPEILLSFFGFASILDRFAHLYPKERQRTVLPFLFVGHRVRKPVQAASILPVSPADAVPRTRPLTASRGDPVTDAKKSRQNQLYLLFFIYH